MSFKPIDPKRDEIRRYLERGSVLDSLTKIFIRVIKERPEDPMEYIRNNIGVVRHQHDKYERLQQDLQSANEEIRRLREIIKKNNPDVLPARTTIEGNPDDTESVTIPQAEAAANIENGEELNAATTVDGIVDEELSAGVAHCHIDEGNVDEDSQNIDNSDQNSVQVESKAIDNAK